MSVKAKEPQFLEHADDATRMLNKRRLADEVRLCEDLDREAADLTKSLSEKQQQLKDLKEKVTKLVESNDAASTQDNLESQRIDAKQESPEKDCEEKQEVIDQQQRTRRIRKHFARKDIWHLVVESGDETHSDCTDSPTRLNDDKVEDNA